MKPFKLNLKGGERNDSPLHIAAEQDSEDICESLIK